MQPEPTRRELLAAALTAGASACLPTAGPPERKADPFRYGLNTSTLRGQQISIVEEVEIAAKAGYDAIEPWISELDQYVKSGGSLADLGKRIRDHGLAVESAIGFFEWIVDDDARRAKALEEARRSMELVAKIGGRRLAAPPVGATERADVPPLKAAERYRALLEVGDQCGVVPQAEVWGFSRTLQRLGEAAQLAIDSDHPHACILPDVYHLYKGGSGFAGVALLSGAALHNFHVNDYPADPPRATITDAQRVYPGDGIAPLDVLFRSLHAAGFRGVLSLELFNRDYWKENPLAVARLGLEKTRAVVHRALGIEGKGTL
jgi:2-keto-myo-inositol isomerase